MSHFLQFTVAEEEETKRKACLFIVCRGRWPQYSFGPEQRAMAAGKCFRPNRARRRDGRRQITEIFAAEKGSSLSGSGISRKILDSGARVVPNSVAVKLHTDGGFDHPRDKDGGNGICGRNSLQQPAVKILHGSRKLLDEATSTPYGGKSTNSHY